MPLPPLGLKARVEGVATEIREISCKELFEENCEETQPILIKNEAGKMAISPSPSALSPPDCALHGSQAVKSQGVSKQPTWTKSRVRTAGGPSGRHGTLSLSLCF